MLHIIVKILLSKIEINKFLTENPTQDKMNSAFDPQCPRSSSSSIFLASS